MDKKTLKALKGSIEKWEKIVAGTGKDEGPNNCPLCKLFNKIEGEEKYACNGCPVKEETGQKYCWNTPYEVYEPNPTKKNAIKELNFLKSLLPTMEAPSVLEPTMTPETPKAP